MESSSRVLEKPVRYFTKSFANYTHVFEYTVEGRSPFFWEDECLIVYVRSGKGRILINLADFPLEAGMIGLLHSYHVFRFESAPGTSLELSAIVFPYPEMVLMDFLPERSAPEYQAILNGAVFGLLDRENQEYAVSLFYAFQEELNHSDNITPLIRNSLLIQLQQIHQEALKKCPPAQFPLCGNLLYYVASHSFNSLTANAVADKFSISTTQLNQELRRVCKQNFQGTLTHARLSNACSMMLRSNISLSALAKQAGFNSEATYYRAFQKVYKTTPHQYRAELIRHLGGETRNSDDRLLEIEFYVLKNCRTPITCESCAKDLFLSKDSINQILRERYGSKSNFRLFLTTMRLRYAEGLLTMSDLPIYDVSVDAGFNSVHTFIRLFRQQYGMTPTEYRRREGAEL